MAGMTRGDQSEQGGRAGGAGRGSVWPKLTLGLFTVVLLLAVGYAAYGVYLGGKQRLHIINGLSRDYAVEIGGRRIELSRKTRVTVELSVGEHRLAVADLEPAIDPIDVRIAIPWWKRPIAKPVFAVNPDRTAVLVVEWPTEQADGEGGSGSGEETSEAAPVPTDAAVASAASQRTMAVFTGQRVYRFEGIDRPWVAAVGREADAKAEAVRLFSWPDFDRERTCALVVSRADEERATTFLKQSATYAADASVYLRFLAGMLETGEMIEYLTPRLADRPIRIAMHRAYQDLIDRARRDHELVERYERLLTDDPTDAARLYLLGRIVPDAERSKSLLASAAAKERIAWPNAALAFMHLCRGEAEAALSRIREAREMAPDKPAFLSYYRSALQAAGRWAALADHWQAIQKINPLDLEAVRGMASAAVRANDEAQARRALEAYTTYAEAAGLNEVKREGAAEIRAAMAAARGDREGYVEAIAGLTHRPWPFRRALLAGDAEAAAAALAARATEPSPFDDLLVAIVAHEHDRAELGARHLERAADRLSELGRSSRELAGHLRGHAAPPETWWRGLELLPDHKRIALTALAVSRPGARDGMLAFVRDRLNFDPGFAHLLLRDVIARRFAPPDASSETPG